MPSNAITPDLFRFLRAIKRNNDRDWFRMRKPQYEEHVRGPMVGLLARLAVDVSEHGQGIGKGLLKDALLRTLQAADIGGLRALLVHAKDTQAKAFYEKFGFASSPLDEFHLMLLLKDVRKIVIGSSG